MFRRTSFNPPAPPSDDARLAQRQRPSRKPVGHQRWSDLLFLHWVVPRESLQDTLPPGLHVDTFEGRAFVGVVPFFMKRIRPRLLPPLPGVSWFLELNVRTYVFDDRGRPGVWFYSLDCNQPLAVSVAQRFFSLPYHHAVMRAERADSVITYECRRERTWETSKFVWSPGGSSAEAIPGSLEFFLIERYLLFTVNTHRQLCTGRVHHAPYRVHQPVLKQWSAIPAAQSGFDVKGEAVSILGAEPVDVEIFALERADHQ